MAVPGVPLEGDDLLVALNDELVTLHERFHHRRPAVAVTRLLEEELLACVMGGVYTEVEKTLIELQQSDLVRAARASFVQGMEREYVSAVERLSGRRVVTFVSTTSVGPDVEVQLFFLEPRGAEQPVAAAGDDR